ncbi:MAG: murein biosynthesis integral membrane protein MurJ [Verrucomicrobiae bacterium]|nr:murein biosynthesis integral membrane protein MurJ [Verrucomicrobiae bacterium]
MASPNGFCHDARAEDESMTASRGQMVRSISAASLIMMGSVLLSRVLGIVREMVLAGMGGTSAAMDAYVAAFLLPEFLNHLLAGGFMSITFIPLFQERLQQGDTPGAWRLFNNLLCAGTLVMSLLVAITWVFTPQILALMGERIGGAAPEYVTRLTRIILPAQIFFYWGALFMAVQYAHQQFFLPALAPLIYNGGIILGGLCLGRWLGIEGFAWGVLAGALAGNALIQLVGLRRLRSPLAWVVDFRDPGLRRYVWLSLPLVLGLGMQFSNEIAFRIFGAPLGEGALASLNYALRIMWALVGLFGQAVGIASFPFLTRLAVSGQMAEMNQIALGVLRRLLLLVLPVSAVLMALAPEVITVVFQRGRFTAESAAQTAPVLQWYLAGAFAFAAMTIVTRCFYALQNTWLPMLASTAIALASLPLYAWLSRGWAAPGIALAGSLGALIQLAVLFWLWLRRHGQQAPLRDLGAGLGQALLAAAVAGGVAAGLRGLLWHSHALAGLKTPFSHALVGLSAGAPALLAAALLLWLLGNPEARQLLKKGSRAGS